MGKRSLSTENDWIMHINIRSIRQNFDELVVYINALKSKPSIICLSEAWISKDFNCDLFKLNEYSPMLYKHGKSRNEGVILYIHQTLTYDEEEIHSSMNIVGAKCVTQNNESFLVFCLYNSPTENKILFCNKLDALMQSYSEKNVPIFILGDVNIDLHKNNSLTNAYYNVIHSSGFSQLVSEPTRVDKNSRTLLDHILHNNYFTDLEVYVEKIDITDHYAVQITLPYKHEQFSRSMLTFKDYVFLKDAQTNYQFQETLKAGFNNLDFTNDLNTVFSKFMDTFKNVVAQFTVIKVIRESKTDKPWITNSIKNAVVKKRNRFRDYRNFPTPKNLSLFKFARAKVKKLINASKKQHYSSKLKSLLQKPKKFFKELNKLTGRIKSNPRLLLKSDGKDITDSPEVANLFNNYFVSIGENIVKKIPPPKSDFSYFEQIRWNERSMFAFPTDYDEVSDTLLSLKLGKSVGFDEISAEILRSCHNVIVPVLVEMINKSLSEGCFPDALKMARVIPLYKSGKRTSIENYRSISILPTISKIFERIMFDRLYCYFTKEKLMYNKQFGFRSGYNTIYALAELIENIRTDNTSIFSSVMLDLSKAFDTIDHKILIKKLERYGVRGICLDWFISYLENRKQFVKIDGSESGCAKINCGVPQGSILGPLLFIIYINDLPNSCQNILLYLFADDTNCLFKRERKQMNYVLDNTLNDLCEWMSQNRLSLNTIKTQLLHFFSGTKCDLSIGTDTIHESSSAKYLGIHIDKRLNFEDHVSYIKRKLSKHIHVFNELKLVVTRDMLLRYYNTFVKSIISYGLLIYGCTSKSKLEPIYKMQKKILRIIYGKKRDHPSHELFECSNILTIYDLYCFELFKFSITAAVQGTPSAFLNNLYCRNSPSDRTRNTALGLFSVAKADSNCQKMSLKFRGTKLMNHLIKLRKIPSNLNELNKASFRRLVSTTN